MSKQSKYFLSDEAIEGLMDIREAKKLTWEQIAEEIGIDNTILSRLKKKQREVNEEYELKIKRYLSKHSKNSNIIDVVNSHSNSNIGDKNRIVIRDDNSELITLYKKLLEKTEEENRQLKEEIEKLKKG